MRGWLARPALATGGALLGGAVVAWVESARAARTSGLAARDIIPGELAGVVPVATVAGLVVAGAVLVADPDRRGWLRRLCTGPKPTARRAQARRAAGWLVGPGLGVLWLIACAHAARTLFGRGEEPWATGGGLAAVSLVEIGAAVAVFHAARAAIATRLVVGDLPVSSWGYGAVGLLAASATAALGMHLGDASGHGRTPLAILGVLTRREIRWEPLAMLALPLCTALLAETVSREGRWGRVLAAALLVGAAWALVVHQASALSRRPEVARSIEQGAPVGAAGLRVLRALLDRDRDGFSPAFAGGDCDDQDPRIHPGAIDVPGNGVDEDCSGADTHVARPASEPTGRPEPVPRDRIPRDLNLVLVTVDTLRVDLGFLGYPRPVSPELDALAARSTVFERAYAMASYTGKSVGPTMIGKYPSETLRDFAHFDTYAEGNTFLAERLRAAGFHTMGAASHWYFKPRYGLSQGMDEWDLTAMPPESAGDADSSVTSPALTDAAIALLSEPQNATRRFFLWVHYFDPHADYVRHPEAPDFRSGAKGWSKPLYDGEVWFTDHHIGGLLRFIASQPWSARTAIVVTADHGEAFDEHGMSYHGVDLWEPVVRVPWLLYVPGAKAKRVAERRSLVDLVPTVLDLLGLPPPPQGELSGVSTAGVILDDEPPEERDVFLDMPWGTQVPQRRAFLSGPSPGMKLLHEGGPVYLLYDLARDPGELNDLSGDRKKLAWMVRLYEDKLATLHEAPPKP